MTSRFPNLGRSLSLEWPTETPLRSTDELRSSWYYRMEWTIIFLSFAQTLWLSYDSKVMMVEVRGIEPLSKTPSLRDSTSLVPSLVMWFWVGTSLNPHGVLYVFLRCNIWEKHLFYDIARYDRCWQCVFIWSFQGDDALSEQSLKGSHQLQLSSETVSEIIVSVYF